MGIRQQEPYLLSIIQDNAPPLRQQTTGRSTILVLDFHLGIRKQNAFNLSIRQDNALPFRH